MSSKSLEIVISSNTSGAVTAATNLANVYDKILNQLKAIQDLSKGKVVIATESGDIRKTIVEPAKRAQEELKKVGEEAQKLSKSGGTGLGERVKKDAEQVKEAAERLRAEIKQLFAAYNESSKLGSSFNKEDFLRDVKQRANSLRRLALDEEGGINKDLLKEAESYQKKRNDLAREFHVQQASADETNAKQTLAKQVQYGEEYLAWRKQWIKENRTLNAAYNENVARAQKEQESLGNSINIINKRAADEQAKLQKELEKAASFNAALTKSGGFSWITGEQASKSAEQSAQVYEKLFNIWDKAHGPALQMTEAYDKQAVTAKRLADITAQLGRAYTVVPGMSPERVKLIQKEIQEVLNLLARVQQETAKAEAMGRDARIKVVSDIQAHNAREAARWSGGEAAGSAKSTYTIGVTQQQADLIKTLPVFDEATKKMVQSRGIVRSFIDDVGSFMSMQVRWFASAGLIFGAMGAIGAATKAMMEFYQSLKNIQAITGASDTGIRQIGEAAVLVAKTTPMAANEAAKLGLKLIQAGLNAEQTAAAMQTVAALVTVTGEDAEAVSKAVTTAMFAWKLEAKDIPQIGQTIAAALNFSRLKVEDLGTAFNYLASTASIMGRSLNETTAAMAVLSNMGIRASTIGTGLTQLWTQLLVPTQKFTKELQRMHLSSNEVNPTMNKMADIVDRLKAKGFDAAKAYSLLGDRAGRELAAALVAGGDAFRNMEDQIQRSTQLTDGFKKALEGPISALKMMRNELEIAAIQVGSVGVPAIQAFTAAATLLLRIVQSVTSGISVLVSWLGEKTVAGGMLVFGLVTALIGAWTKYGKAATEAGRALSWIQRIIPFLLNLHPALKAVGVAILALGAIGSIWGKSSENVSAAYKAAEAQKALQAENARRLEEQAKQAEESITRLKEAWQSTAKSEPNLPYIEKLRTFQTEISAAIDGLVNLREKWILLGETPGPKHLGSPEEGGVDPRIKKLLDQENAGLHGVTGADAFRAYNKQAQNDRLFNKASELYQAFDSERAVGEAANEALRNRSHTDMERLEILRKDLVAAVDLQKVALGQAIDAYRKETDKDRKDALLKNVTDAAQKLNLAQLAALPNAVDLANIKKTWADNADKAVESLREVKDEAKRVAAELAALGKVDPIGDLMRSGQAEIDVIEKRIGKVGAKIKEAQRRAGGKDNADIQREIVALKEEQDVLEKIKKDTAQGISVKVSLKTQDMALEFAKVGVQASNDLYDQIKRRVDIAKQVNAISGVDASRLEYEVEQKKLDLSIEALKTEKLQADARQDWITSARLGFQIELAGGEKNLLRLQQEHVLRQAVLEDYKKTIGTQLDLAEMVGANVSREREWLDIQIKINEIVAARPDLVGQATEAFLKLDKAMNWDTRPFAEAMAGLWEGIKLGARQAAQGMIDASKWGVRIGTDMLNSFQRSASDFFYNLSTAEGFDKSKYKNFWSYFQDVVDDLLKSIYKSFMRTLGDLWSSWLSKGIASLLDKAGIGAKEFGTSSAGASTGVNSLTASIFGQVTAVEALTSALESLRIAQAAVGMGGGGFGLSSLFSGSASSPSFTGTLSGPLFSGGSGLVNMPIPHGGGMIFHSGGYVGRAASGIAPDERLALVQTGEYVISRKGVRALDAINSGNVSGGNAQPQATHNHFYIHAVDARSFSDIVKRNPGAIVEVMGNDMRMAGSSRNSIRKYT